MAECGHSKELISYLAALQKIEDLAVKNQKFLKSLEVTIDKALGKILSHDFCAVWDSPYWDTSAMDGFAVRAETLKGASSAQPIWLESLGVMSAGMDPRVDPVINAKTKGSIQINGAHCLEIMTGAQLPQGYDSIVKVEDVLKEQNKIGFGSEPPKGSHIRPAGSDYKKGQIIAKKGQYLRPIDLMSLSSAGAGSVNIYQDLKVVIINTGAELINDPSQMSAGKIINSSGPFLEASLKILGADFKQIDVYSDSPIDFKKALSQAMESNPDLILSTGAVSMGKFDFVAPCLDELGAQTIFHKVAIRPGKPILFCSLGQKTAFFGLPGNPISTAVGFEFFVKPYLDKLFQKKSSRFFTGILKEDFKIPPHMTVFCRGRFLPPYLEIMPEQESYKVGMLGEANIWIIIDACDQKWAKAGSEVRFCHI